MDAPGPPASRPAPGWEHPASQPAGHPGSPPPPGLAGGGRSPENPTGGARSPQVAVGSALPPPPPPPPPLAPVPAAPASSAPVAVTPSPPAAGAVVEGSRPAPSDPRAAAATGDAPTGFDGVGKSFDDKVAVHDVTFDIPAGSILGLIGPSGCGKTTLLRMLVGLYRPTDGRVRLLGHDPMDAGPALRQRVGYMPQLSVLFPNLSLEDNLRFSAALYGVRWRGRRARLRRLLDFVDLLEHRQTLLGHASGGMQRRLSLAATLVHDPELLVLDEPTAGIDPILRARFWQRFRELRDEGRTLVVSTQYVGEAAECDQVAVMVDGELLAVDTPEGLARRAFGPGGPDGDGEPPDYDDVFVHLVRQARAERQQQRRDEGGR